jgi:hypothetical protein
MGCVSATHAGHGLASTSSPEVDLLQPVVGTAVGIRILECTRWPVAG